MGCGIIPAGSERFVESEWHNNPMPSLYNDDAIHAFQIQMSEELHVLDLAKVNDPVLKRLLDMGCFDWKTPNSVSGPGNRIAYSAVVVRATLHLDAPAALELLLARTRVLDYSSPHLYLSGLPIWT